MTTATGNEGPVGRVGIEDDHAGSTAAHVDEVRYQVVDHVATLTLDAPERMNTISGAMLEAISELLLTADRCCSV